MKGTIRKVRIGGTGSHAPARVLTNDDLSKMVDTNDAWIRERTGIRERRIAGPGEAPSDLALVAARRAIEAAGIAPDDLDLIVVGTSNPDYLLPNTACCLQAKLGAFRAGAVDVNAACSGFLYALSTGWHHAASGAYRNVLVVGAETLSKMTNYKDRGTCILFGDAAGAVVLQPSQDGSDILHVSLGADGRMGDYINVPGGCSAAPPTHEGIDRGDQYIHMRGREVYQFAVRKMHELTRDVLAACGLGVADMNLLIPHQVNLRIIESACERLGLPLDRVYINIERYGNTSAASVPVALDEAVRGGRLKRGDIAVLVAFGAGLTWGGAVVRY